MPSKHFAKFRYGPNKQHGAALLIMLVILVIGGVAILVNSLSRSGLQNARNEVNAIVLAQAKDALIGYAITYYDTHSTPTPQTFGFLPCPDPNGAAGINGEGSSETCGSKNVSTIGRLPWKTLGLPVLRDANGECLWYAVAGTYKNNPDTDIMDWDTNGLFQVLASSGVTLAGSTTDSQALAIVFSPDVPLSGQSQNRAPDGNAPICGGNYTASNYLDSDATISANNAAPSTVANAVSQFFTAGATTNINDRIIFITKDDIFNAIKKRNGFDTFVTTLLSAATTCLSALPAPVTINFDTMNETTVTTAVGSLYVGRIPSSALTSCANNNLVKQWRDNLLYACISSGSSCLTGSNNGVVIFAGEKDTSVAQQRVTNTDKNTWSNYLEDAPSTLLTAFNNGDPTPFSGASPSYSASSPSTDVLAFIP